MNEIKIHRNNLNDMIHDYYMSYHLHQNINRDIKIGECGHYEYIWSDELREMVYQLNYQLVRVQSQNQLDILTSKYNRILACLYYHKNKPLRNELLITLYKLIGYTRDIISGKGEYMLTYMMILSWYHYFPDCAKYALYCCVISDINSNIYRNEHAYGSWKDIKYFCDYCRNITSNPNHPLILHAIKLINEQVRIDYTRKKSVSLAAKWIPNEKSKKFAWLYKKMAQDYFASYFVNCSTSDSRYAANNKAYMNYRKICSDLNKLLDTPQIKQCNGEWQNINVSLLTSATWMKQRKALLNISTNKQSNDKVVNNNLMRHICSENCKTYINNIKNNKNGSLPGKSLGIEHFTKQAMNILKNPSQTEMDILNLQWEDYIKSLGKLDDVLCILDVSMKDDGLYASIAIACSIVCRSPANKRILAFSDYPVWINLDSMNTFTEMVTEILNNIVLNTHSNFYSTIDRILYVCIENNLEPSLIESMTIVILSDMQIDPPHTIHNTPVCDVIKKMYKNAGLLNNQSYEIPHILFWNVRSTDGFPCLFNNKNISMVSGFNPNILNIYCKHKPETDKILCNPWTAFLPQLSNNRYDILECFGKKHISLE